MERKVINYCDLKPGAVLFLERNISGLPYPTGYWVLCKISAATATFALLDQSPDGELIAQAERFEVSTEDLAAFTLTAEIANPNVS